MVHESDEHLFTPSAGRERSQTFAPPVRGGKVFRLRHDSFGATGADSTIHVALRDRGRRSFGAMSVRMIAFVRTASVAPGKTGEVGFRVKIN